ncbi:hypothetical protein [Thauera sp.]
MHRHTPIRLAQWATVLALGCLALAGRPALAAAQAQDYSAAERIIFMSEHLSAVKPPQLLEYSFRKHGTLEAGFEARVALRLSPTDAGVCCDAEADFLSAERRTRLPEVEDARANPIILYFLEHDVRDMNRLTKGQPNHFRKRIRMAIYDGARVEHRDAHYRGRSVAVQEVSISPYDDDPNRERFAQYADKQYVFWLSEAVPGGVLGMATRMNNPEAGAEPLVVEELVLDGATLPALPPRQAALGR